MLEERGRELLLQLMRGVRHETKNVGNIARLTTYILLSIDIYMYTYVDT